MRRILLIVLFLLTVAGAPLSQDEKKTNGNGDNGESRRNPIDSKPLSQNEKSSKGGERRSDGLEGHIGSTGIGPNAANKDQNTELRKTKGDQGKQDSIGAVGKSNINLDKSLKAKADSDPQVYGKKPTNKQPQTNQGTEKKTSNSGEPKPQTVQDESQSGKKKPESDVNDSKTDGDGSKKQSKSKKDGDDDDDDVVAKDDEDKSKNKITPGGSNSLQKTEKSPKKEETPSKNMNDSDDDKSAADDDDETMQPSKKSGAQAEWNEPSYDDEDEDQGLDEIQLNPSENMFAKEKSETIGKVNRSSETNSSSSFVTYFVIAAAIVIILYLVFHNKKKLMAYIIEGRNTGRVRRNRGTSGSEYKPLKNSDEGMGRQTESA